MFAFRILKSVVVFRLRKLGYIRFYPIFYRGWWGGGTFMISCFTADSRVRHNQKLCKENLFGSYWP